MIYVILHIRKTRLIKCDVAAELKGRFVGGTDTKIYIYPKCYYCNFLF